ncbi:GGDEF domain-containing protein [Dasania sp. GY-MA-18]|uniref:diguanylate cyclase n=1 Tax=Dasania phycosphaerae TaxID=2950436 RepID=A0A9J6RLF4_9GAMM|nr:MULTISPECIES: GGDEF domain-containing protein [Dasania]MCR8922409.1 GGDEF domain-containing protein [Dasania sp. GY-MA-18]MCZ0864837.1 GGDEF domain-containing protein [Dasania phycosphaerae]MCZ0868565.1 GGDEF domain-containing protein [Dasania phycosphaerae]
MKKAKLYCYYLVSFLLLSNLSLANLPLEKIRMQLRWHHQFQFAGYYAAKQQGYYRQAGFDVEIIAGNKNRQPVAELLNGRADFAEGNSEVLLARLKGQPLVALAAIYQRSPSILITRKDSQINSTEDLINKTVMLVDGVDSQDADLLAMLYASHSSLENINIIPSSYNIADLYQGKVHAFNAYISNEPFYLEERGIAYTALKPEDYGIDFYSDILFTSQAMAKNNPDKVQRFVNATLKGWQYALDYPEEIIQLLKQQYQSPKSLNHLRYEANMVRKLIIPELISIGHIHPGRLERMATTFQDLGMIDNTAALSGFVFNPSTWQDRLFGWWPYFVAILASLIAALLVQAYTNKRLSGEIERRKKAEQELKKLALTDHLTKLHNPRSFHQLLSAELKRSQRNQSSFSLIAIDIDFFKAVNDQYGHHIGDEVLQHVAQILCTNLRESDMCNRVGGEEFIIILPDTPEQRALELAERSRLAIEKSPFIKGEIYIGLTMSFGVTQWQPKDEINDTLERADQALYYAKRHGRNRVQLFKPEMAVAHAKEKQQSRPRVTADNGAGTTGDTAPIVHAPR